MERLEIPLYELPRLFDKLSDGNCLYYWMAEGEHLYIGETRNIKRRIRQHINNFERFVYEADMLVLEFPVGFTVKYYDYGFDELLQLEYKAIKTHNPKYNLKGTLNKTTEDERRYIGSERVFVREFYNKLSSYLSRSEKPIFDTNGEPVEKPIKYTEEPLVSKWIPDQHFRCKTESRIFQITKGWDYNEWRSFRKYAPYQMTYHKTLGWDFHRKSLLSALQSYVSENQY